jgi:UDP-hydrolysing UDP-N-acetyl-D-glucosamine 2-epimerase
MKVHYLSGSRADFGLMRRTLQTLAADAVIDLSVVLTGQALIPRYGDVEREVADVGLAVAGRVRAELGGNDALEMALALSTELSGLATLWAQDRPDFVLLLGDRGEMLAAAIAAFHLEIATGHIHGGELSGTLDEGFRHAISKLASWHFPATDQSAERLRRMGEFPERIVKIGAPGLVELASAAPAPTGWLAERFGLSAGKPVGLIVFHPVVQEAEQAFAQTREILAAVADSDMEALALRPNSDAGGREIDRCLTEIGARTPLVVLDHLTRPDYLRALGAAEVIIGNSSSGIIESASLGTPCVNVGSRQEGRERNANVVDCPQFDRRAISEAIARARRLDGPFVNIYGDGGTDVRLRDTLKALVLGERAPKKRNAY